MKFLIFFFILSILSRINAQQCQARFNQSIIGIFSPIHTCQGAILNSDINEEYGCCIGATPPPPTPQTCITVEDTINLPNTNRTTFLRTVLNYGIYAAGICQNCQAKAAFLAIAATMTENFQTDEATGNDAQFAADDTKYGNSQEGDGSRFRRRGFFGLRGRRMYERLQTVMPQYQSLANPEAVALTQNSIVIAAKLWMNPDLLSEPALTPYADGSFYGFSMIWYKLNGDIAQLATAVKYYSTFLRELECGGDLYPGQGPVCQFNQTHQGTCSPDCITGLDDFSASCGCSGPKGEQCPNSPKHIRCCLDTCSQELKMDLGIVLDASGSVLLPNYQLQLNFTKNLLHRVNVGQNKTHVGIINFSDSPEILTWLNRDYTLDDKLRQIGQATYFSKGTNTHLALQQADTVFLYSNGRRLSEEGVTPVIFVITDGISGNQAATLQAASVLKQKNIVLVSVGVGSGPRLSELHGICTPPVSENYFAMSDYNALEQKLNQFTSKSCSEPVSIPSNSTVTGEIGKDKYKFIKVKIVITGKRILITVKLFNGKVKLFYSFTNRNPKDPADFIDYEAKTSDNDPTVGSQFKSYFQQLLAKIGTPKNGDVQLVIDRPDNDTDVAYIGVKGIEEDNKFEVKFDDCEKVFCPTSTAPMIKLSIVLAIISALFVL